MAASALLALTAVQAVSQVSQGYAQRAEARYNASILEGQAGLIQVQKDIENAQYERLKSKTWSTSMARLGGMGIMPTGSAAAAMSETHREISIDQAVGQFNFAMQKNYKMSEAESEKRRGKFAVRAGWTNAFTSMLKGGYEYGQLK